MATAPRSSTSHLDRNWQELLQELRVAQTSVQILTGFLLTIPFTPRFADLSSTRQGIYCAVLCAAVLANLLLMTPVVLHRALFHQGARPWLVETADRLARWGIGVQTVAIIGVVWLILDFICPAWVAASAATSIALFVLVVWVLLPARERRSTEQART